MKINNKKRIFSPPQPEKQRSLKAYILKYSMFFWVEALAGIAYNSILVFGPILQGKLLDVAVASSKIKDIIYIASVFILTTAFFQVLRYFKRYYLRYLANLMSADMRVGIVDSVLNRNMEWLQQKKVGDLMSRTIGDIDEVVEAIRKTITEVWDTWVLMLAYFVVLMIKDYKITLLAVIPIPIAILLAESLKGKVYKASMDARNSSSEVSSNIRTLIMNTGLLRLFGLEEAQLKRLDGHLVDQAEKNAKASVLKNGMGAIYSTIASLGILIVISLCGGKAITGLWSIGDFTSYVIIYSAMSLRTTTAAKVFNVQQGAKASWKRIFDLFDNNSISNNYKSDINLKCDLEFNLLVHNLSFRYLNSPKSIICDISFKAKPGSIIGITGAVGSGKSSLAKALTGLYPYEGSIKINGIELSTLSDRDRSSVISYMGHNSTLFSDTIKNNIAWGDYDYELLEKVYNISALKNDFVSFKDGMETQLGVNGQKVSGGQHQRIALARACYSRAGILILDDPFSAIDIGTEAEIIEQLRNINPNGVIIILSHRLAVFEKVDQILVLDKGKILQQGTHNELCQTDGIYKEIVNAQNFIERSKNYEE